MNVMNSKKRQGLNRTSVRQTVHYMLVAFVQYLGDCRGWKPESIVGAIRHIMTFTEAITNGVTSITEAEEEIYQNYGIQFLPGGVIRCERRDGDG